MSPQSTYFVDEPIGDNAFIRGFDKRLPAKSIDLSNYRIATDYAQIWEQDSHGLVHRCKERENIKDSINSKQ